MIGPADIQKKQFTRGVRGYKEEEVDEFLNLITDELETLIRENDILQATVRSQQVEIDRHRNSEQLIFDTLESAKGLMSDISVSAEKRAEIVLKNAELDAARMRREATESVEFITEEAKEISRRWDQFSVRFKNLLQTELDRFDSLSADLISDPDRTGFYTDDPKFTDQNIGKASRQRGEPIKFVASEPNKDHTIKTTKRNGL